MELLPPLLSDDLASLGADTGLAVQPWTVRVFSPATWTKVDRIHSGILQARSLIRSSWLRALVILETTLADSPSFPM